MSESIPLEIPDSMIERIADLVQERLDGRFRREYLDTSGAAAYLAMSRGRLDKLCAGAIDCVEPIPVHREGNRRLFVRQELDAWIDSGGAELA